MDECCFLPLNPRAIKGWGTAQETGRRDCSGLRRFSERLPPGRLPAEDLEADVPLGALAGLQGDHAGIS